MGAQHRIRVLFSSVALIGLVLIHARASSASESVVAAVNAIDVTALETLSSSAPTADRRTLAAGALLALRHEDGKAIAKLLPLARSTADRAVRATAYLVLSDLYGRDQRYRACYSAIHAALRLSPASVNASYRQTMVFARALFGVKPMKLLRETPGSLPIADERLGMIRVPIKVNGHQGGALLDTGAAFSTIKSSVAKRLGIHMLRRRATVGSSTERAFPVQLGIAKRLRIGNAVFENVVFIVVPDAALPIPDSLGIRAVIGLPVLMALGRLEFVNSATPTLRYGLPPDESACRAGSCENMVLSSFEPLVLVRVSGAGAPLRMELDTGSNATMFTRNAVMAAPKFFAGAKRYVWHVGGVGGTIADHRAMHLKNAALLIGGRRVILKDVIVSSRASATKDGVLGANILREGARWSMDFKTLRLAVGH